MTGMQPKRRRDAFRTVTPYLTCAGAADAIEFYKKAFGAEEMIRVPGADGRIMHACIMIGDSPVMLSDEFPGQGVVGPKSTGGTPVMIHLFVDDVDAFAARAVEAGAKITLPIAEQFWGDRYGQLEDPFGHRWSVATPGKDMTPEEIREAAAKMGACG
jgi:PhnB protein